MGADVCWTLAESRSSETERRTGSHADQGYSLRRYDQWGLQANIYLHFAFDKWIGREFPQARFEQYSDDAVIHCVSERQARYIKSRIAVRLKECRLELNEEKTKIVFCRNSNNREKTTYLVSFQFLGYTFLPRYCPTKYGLQLLTAACMSESAKGRIRYRIRKFSIRKFGG